IWIGCLGFARLSGVYDRLHCATFVAASAGPLLTLAAFWADGASDRAWKILLLVILVLVNGAGVSHAASRALAWRESAGGTQ
ncbi:MAG TPA: monovalent cation/H(+) antiporter subunit G, partial [Rhodopila sp.]|nr:monovalent cation/H(+) antiporter subunit G [Rhodopila sp.]